MSIVRRLKYRDRFVWSLTQTMTGGSGALPPVVFQDDVSTDILISLTGNEFNKILSCLMTGADLAYPDQSHEIVWSFLKQIEYPKPMISQCLVSRADFTARFSSVNGGTLTRTSASWMTIPYVWLTDTTANRQIIEPLYLTPGLYDYDGLYAKTVSSGIVRIDIRDQANNVVAAIVSGIDQYGSFNAEYTVGGSFEITEAGYYRLTVTNEGTKNALSAGYQVNWCLHSVKAYTL